MAQTTETNLAVIQATGFFVPVPVPVPVPVCVPEIWQAARQT